MSCATSIKYFVSILCSSLYIHTYVCTHIHIYTYTQKYNKYVCIYVCVFIEENAFKWNTTPMLKLKLISMSVCVCTSMNDWMNGCNVCRV